VSKEVYLSGAVLSMLVSFVLYLSGRREAGLFVGLWAPTILLLGDLMLEEDRTAARRGLLRRDR
jgi:hypothetical protein